MIQQLALLTVKSNDNICPISSSPKKLLMRIKASKEDLTIVDKTWARKVKDRSTRLLVYCSNYLLSSAARTDSDCRSRTERPPCLWYWKQLGHSFLKYLAVTFHSVHNWTKASSSSIILNTLCFLKLFLAILVNLKVWRNYKNTTFISCQGEKPLRKCFMRLSNFYLP